MVAVERVAGGFAAYRLAGGLVDVAAAAIDGVGRSEGRGVLDGLGIATAGAFEKVRPRWIWQGCRATLLSASFSRSETKGICPIIEKWAGEDFQ